VTGGAVAAVTAGVLVVTLAVLVLGRRAHQAGLHATELEAELETVRERLAEAEKMETRLGASLGAMDHGVVIFGRGGVSVYHNEPAALYLDARHGDALVEKAITDMAGTVRPGRTLERELEVYGPPRRSLILRAISLAPSSRSTISRPENRPEGVLVVVEDVTERRRLENVRSDFVANISHELKTPVGALALLAETLIEEDDPAVIRRLAERVVGEAFRVAHTIEDLSQLSRLEVDPGELDEQIPVATFLDEAVDRVRSAAERRAITLRVTAPPRELTVQGDRRQLVSAVANLLDNAVKYSDPGSPVELRAGLDENDSSWARVEVRDHGIGIPRHDLQRIFERFYRVDRARSRETGGTGLGLAIVRHVAANHRGEVLVDSREGEGSCFTLCLPTSSRPPDTQRGR
jgi:two-component system, OmpR family, sensor histidine kinase SenX3